MIIPCGMQRRSPYARRSGFEEKRKTGQKQDQEDQPVARKTMALLAAALGIMLCCCGIGAGAETGIVYDEDGGVWNFDTGIYTTPDGVSVKIQSDGTNDSGSSGSNSGGSSGAMTVVDSSGIEGIPVNADGSITVESGQIQIQDDSATSSPGLTQEEWEARMKKAIERNGAYTETYYFGPEKDPIPVSVVYVGLARSMIKIGSSELMVNTCDLAWSTEASANQVLAVVDANKAGYAALRANTSTKSFILDHCITGKVVRVLATGKNWTKVDYEGMRGYVLTSSLKFYPNVIRSYEIGQIAYEGRTTGRSTINIRANNKNNSRILGNYVLGTPLTIFSRDEKWCEVDVAGWHCYILTEYVSLAENGNAMASKQ